MCASVSWCWLHSPWGIYTRQSLRSQGSLCLLKQRRMQEYLKQHKKADKRSNVLKVLNVRLKVSVNVLPIRDLSNRLAPRNSSRALWSFTSRCQRLAIVSLSSREISARLTVGLWQAWGRHLVNLGPKRQTVGSSAPWDEYMPGCELWHT